MDVIRHDHVFFYPNCRIPRRDRLYLFFHDLANGRQRDRGRGTSPSPTAISDRMHLRSWVQIVTKYAPEEL